MLTDDYVKFVDYPKERLNKTNHETIVKNYYASKECHPEDSNGSSYSGMAQLWKPRKWIMHAHSIHSSCYVNEMYTLFSC